jgi:predicted ATPase
MPFTLTQFTIHGLHGERTIRIPIRDNRIVMVGVNGLGKTTVVNLLYLVLSKQWDRALEYDFSAIDIEFNGNRLLIPRKARATTKADAARFRRALSRYFPTSIFHRIIESPEFDILAQGNLLTTSDIAQWAVRLNVAPGTLVKVWQQLTPHRRPFDEAALAEADELLKPALKTNQVLYLPTYRRIEKDLSLIFPDLEEHIQAFNRRRSVEARGGGRSYIELVEFGMEDVETTFRRVRDELNISARVELNSLAGGYLRDVIRGEGHTYDPGLFQDLDENTVVTILNRVEEKTLSETDKQLLRTVIHKIRQNPVQPVAQNEQYIAHFFSKLVAVHKALLSREEAISRFVRVCDKYLTGKQLVYEDKNYKINVLLDSGRPITLRDLSSGEKQIVSLFSHLYLQSEGDAFLLIDEPELSLSVAWQKSLLPDLLETDRCAFLAAVTHSPFIFDNSLEPYAVDLAECIERSPSNELS